MPEDIDWTLTTFDGNRRRQHREFRALPLREKLLRIEEMGEVAAFFGARRAAREGVVGGEGGQSPPSGRSAGEGVKHD